MTASLSLKQDGPVVELTLAARSPDNLISPSFSRELQAACEQIGSDEACRAVLLTAEGDIFSRGWDWRAVCSRIAERGPIAVAYAKEAVTRGIEMPLEQALRYETDLTIILQTTEDRAEGVRAFLEKRKPEFKGE